MTLNIKSNRKAGTVTVTVGQESCTIPRRELMALLGVPNPRVKTSAITRAYRQNVKPEEFRRSLLQANAPKGSVSKMEKVLAGLNNGAIEPNQVSKKSLNWCYVAVSKTT